MVLTARGGRATFFRVKVKDSGGTFRDLSTYAGRNLCVAAMWKENVDSQGIDADITLKREVEKISLAPLMANSPANLAFAYPGTYAALLELRREVQIEVAVVPDGVAVQSGDWNLAFHGYIDEIDPAEGEHVKLRCSDLQGTLRDTWIERERLYAFAQGVNATKGCLVWRPTDTIAVGDRISPTDGQKTGHFYRATAITTGITAASEPTWPTGGGATVVDGGVTWTESGSTSLTSGTLVETVMQQIIDDNLGAGVVTLSVPVSPAWAIKAYKQDRVSVWDALRMLTDQIGWDLRFRWNTGSSSFKLTFSAPNRTAAVADRTFGPSQRYKLNRLPTQIAFIRNVVQVVYSDSAALDAAGRPTRKTVVRTNAGSITAYGRRFAEIAEGSTSNIDTSTEATTLADNALSDLANPVAEHECEVPFFRHVELGDYYTWQADGVHYDSSQSLGVTGYAHRITGGESPTARTQIVCRGKPSAGFRRWSSKMGYDQHALDLGNTNALAVTTSFNVGGAQFGLSGTELKNALPLNAEVHVSSTPGFTPSASTLKKQGAASDLALSDLIPGQTYYSRVIPYGHNRTRLVKGQPSPEISFVAGQAKTSHLEATPRWGRQPLNGGFETITDPGPTAIPDHWTKIAGGSAIGMNVGSGGVGGNRWMNFDVGSAACDLRSDLIQIDAGRQYRFSMYAFNNDVGTAGSVDLYVKLYQSDGVTPAAIFPEAVCNVPFTDAAVNGQWGRKGTYFVAGSDALYARVGVRSSGASFNSDFQFDNIEFEPFDFSPNTLSVASGGAATTTSGTFATIATLNISDYQCAGRLLAQLSLSCFSTVAATDVEFRLRYSNYGGIPINAGVDYNFLFSQANVHQQLSFIWNVGRPAYGSLGFIGSNVTVEIQWRRVAGTGTLTIDAHDNLSLLVF